MPPTQIIGHLAMLSLSFLVAGSFSLGSTIAHLAPPDALTALRFSAGALLMGSIAVLSGKVKADHLKRSWRFLPLGGLFSIYFVTMFEALKITQPVSTSAVFTLAPPLTAIFSYFILSQVSTKRISIALIIGAIGALWVIFRAELSAFLNFNIGKGEAIFIIGVMAHALYTPLFRKLSKGDPVIVSTFGVMLGGAIVLWAFSFNNIVATNWSSLPVSFWLVFIYLVVAASSLTFFLLQFAALRLPSAKVMAYTYLVPSWVIFWEYARGNGLPDIKILIGIAITTLSLIMLLKNED
jgi:drug/metabolite transporter (DMT)-like permease